MLIFSRYHTLLKGLFLIWVYMIDAGNANKIHGQLPDPSLISTLFSMFVKPYLRTWNTETAFRALEESTIEKAVRQKVEKLKPFLQDDEFNIQEKDNKITFEGNDETTIIEFLPSTGEEYKTNLRNDNNTFKANMRRYKKLRTKIDKALEKEMVSDKTKKLVMKTLDELISRMIETQCNWKSSAPLNIQRNRLIVPRAIVNTWNKEFQKFKTTFSTLVNYRTHDRVKHKDNLMVYLNNLNNLIKDVSDNLETFSKRYKFNCNISEREHFKKNKENKGALRTTKLSYDTDSKTNSCKHFKICSTELRSFFIDFYTSLNDTTVNVLRSYGEMFTRDVNTDVSNEKNSIISLIFNTGDELEKHVIKAFINVLNEFKLDDQKNKEANIILLSNYVRDVMRHVKQEVSSVLEVILQGVSKKVYQSIQQDVTINLDVDLGNLERDLLTKICLIFNVCNNHHKSGRRMNSNVNDDDENKIYVKVELTMDDEFKDALKNNTLRRSLELNARKFFDVDESLNMTTMLWNTEKYANISVTRTTLI
ncbi:uncharacterized protein [Epargyreus clarus]|uniref:uncharacterized protein n=1 Tax=Epargyreus clarus TaxID=520877 RepID=UPI003C2B63F6